MVLPSSEIVLGIPMKGLQSRLARDKTALFVEAPYEVHAFLPDVGSSR